MIVIISGNLVLVDSEWEDIGWEHAARLKRACMNLYRMGKADISFTQAGTMFKIYLRR